MADFSFSDSSVVNLPSEIQSLSWFHDTATRHTAESLLMQNGSDGSYLMRPSFSKPGDLAISTRCRNSVRHFNVVVGGDQVQFGLANFPSLKDFLDHLDKQPVVAGESGQMVWLRYPYPRQIQEPSVYEHIRIHAQYGCAASRTSDPQQQLSIASKEGYMTKLGGIVKNWKPRWFVLSRYELKYFRQQTDDNPIRVLDLRNCAECVADNTKSQSNCFRLVFPSRTFYFICESEQDMKEWIDLIQWKLKQLQNHSP